MDALISKILDHGGVFIGGFVRDYLILGEHYNDIDFILRKDAGIKITNWKDSYMGREFVHNDTVFHWQYSFFPTDISCNFFGFSSEGIISRPTKINYSYEKSLRLIFEKKYVYFCPQDDMRVALKMRKRGWKMCQMLPNQITTEMKSPLHGSWESLNDEATKRIKSLT